LILKHKAHESTLGIKPTHEGIDFFYANEGQAKKMLDFLTSVVPCRYQVSKTVISQDIHSNTYNCKFTYSVEIVPVCKDCVVCLPAKLAHQLGGIGQICVVQRVSSTIHLIDPFSGQSTIYNFKVLKDSIYLFITLIVAEVNSNTYWRTPFNALSGTKQLAEYVVMDIEIIRDHEKRTFAGPGAMSYKVIF
jgi:nonsense-mediated mRNA decay protein 3